MLDPKTLPDVQIRLGTYGSVEIKKENRYIYLNHSGETWHQFNIQNQRELHEQWSTYDLAYGDVLISGFGFGHMAQWLANKSEVSSVTVIEISQDVIDAFMESNQLNNKVRIIIGDANTLKLDKHYDCVILDHISNIIKPQDFYKDLCSISKNISHDLFWFWSIEMFYLRYFYDIRIRDMYITPIDFEPFDFSTKWEELRNYLNVPTIPFLSKDKIDSYVNSYFLRHLLQKKQHQ
jgi:hypothetical protein